MANGIADNRAWQYFEEWSEEDTYLPMEAELEELERIGFEAFPMDRRDLHEEDPGLP